MHASDVHMWQNRANEQFVCTKIFRVPLSPLRGEGGSTHHCTCKYMCQGCGAIHGACGLQDPTP